MPRSSKTETLSAPAMRRAAARIRSSSTPQRRAKSAIGNAREILEHRARRRWCARRGTLVQQVLLDERRAQRSQAPGVGPRPHAQVEVGELGCLGDDRVDARSSSARGPSRSRAATTRARGKLCDMPRVLADEDRRPRRARSRRACGRRRASVDPDLAGLLLGQRARAVARAERPQERSAVGAAEVVSLAAAAVVEDRLAAVLVAEPPRSRRRSRRSPCPSRSPRSCRRPPPQRRGQAVAAVLVVVEPHRLVAGVALRGRVRLVAADPSEGGGRRAGPRCRSCTRRGCRRSGPRSRFGAHPPHRRPTPRRPAVYLAPEVLQRRQVAVCPAENHRALEAGDDEHRQLIGPRLVDPGAMNASAITRLPAVKGSGDLPAKVRAILGGLDGDCDHRTTGPEVGRLRFARYSSSRRSSAASGSSAGAVPVAAPRTRRRSRWPRVAVARGRPGNGGRPSRAARRCARGRHRCSWLARRARERGAPCWRSSAGAVLTCPRPSVMRPMSSADGSEARDTSDEEHHGRRPTHRRRRPDQH